MVGEPLTAEDLMIAGEHMISGLHEEMTREERRLIVSVMGENPRGICWERTEARISLLFNGSFKTYAEWRRQNTVRHYENSVITLTLSRVSDVCSSNTRGDGGDLVSFRTSLGTPD